MNEAHAYLTTRLEGLRASRAFPVFFIEHGLAEQDLAEVRLAVRLALKERPLADSWWNTRYLPLVVLATEVGYRYRGSGTDFWPVLAQEFDYEFRPGERGQVRDFFAKAASRFNGARPPATPWAQAFHLIAWPITHALLPLELHRPFALTLAGIRGLSKGLDDDSLHRLVRISARATTTRFDSLVRDKRIVVRLVRAVLEESGHELSGEMVDRLTRDLDRDFVARRGVRLARGRQRRLRVAEETLPDAQEQVQRIGSLQLTLSPSESILEGALPAYEGGDAAAVRRTLRRRRFAPRLWGLTQPIPSEQLLSGLPFRVGLNERPEQGADFLPGLADLGLSSSAVTFLQSLDLPIADTMLFSLSRGGDQARFVKGPEISGHREYVLLSVDRPPVEARLPSLGTLGPFHAVSVDPGIEANRRHVETLGYRFRFNLKLVPIGFPMKAPSHAPLHLMNGDTLFVVPEQMTSSQFRACLGTDEKTGSEEECLALTVPLGHNRLEASSGSATGTLEFVGVATPCALEQSRPVCSIDLLSRDLAIGALVRGDLSFAINAIAPIEGVELRAEVSGNDFAESSVTLLNRLPTTVSSGEPPLADLRDRIGVDRLYEQGFLKIRLAVGNLTSREWRLEKRVRACWWEQLGARFRLTSDLGDLEYGAVPAVAPLRNPGDCKGMSAHGVSLLCPADPDVSEFGPAARYTGLCVAPGAGTLALGSVELPPTCRSLRSRDEALGMRELVDAYLRWSTADSNNALAEIRRRQVAATVDRLIARVACGDVWVDLEERLDWIDPWEALLGLARERHLGRDSYLDGISDSSWATVLQLFLKELRLFIPDLWYIARPKGWLEEGHWGFFESGLEKAYARTSQFLIDGGHRQEGESLLEGDPTADFEPSQWSKTIRATFDLQDLGPVVAKLMPTDSFQQLSSIDPEGLTPEDVAEELHAWASANGTALVSGVPTQTTLLTLARIWIEPNAVVGGDWSGALPLLVADRSLSRAARYLALRFRQSQLWSSR